ncbi:MAG: Sir2 family NAD-dependent protein deacetylase [Pseudomonadota bacterium]
MSAAEPGSVADLRRRLLAAERIVVFTGAGVSTESGIPDFRSPGTGLWSRMRPIPFDEFLADDAVRQESWRRRFEHGGAIESASPNRGHRAVAQLVAEGRCHTVITQNIDGLHQASGIAPQQVVELHGNGTYATCLSCEQRFELDALEAQFDAAGRIDPCPSCGGIIKAATISFGQAMPIGAMALAEAAINDCDLCLTLGSSLSVFPAAAFPQRAVELGASLIIINREETPLDPLADLRLGTEIGPTLGEALAVG